MAAFPGRRDLREPSVNRNGQAVTVIVAFSMTVVGLCLLTRLYMRWPWRKMMSRNDWIALCATAFAIGNAVAASIAVQHGLGEQADSLSTQGVNNTRKALLIGQLFFYLCAASASSAVIEFLIQIKGCVRTPILTVLRIVTPIWGLAGLIVMATFLALDPDAVPDAAFIALDILGCVIGIATFVAAALVTIPLQTSRMRRAHVLMSFSPSFVNTAVFIICAVVIASRPVSSNFTAAMTNYTIALEVNILFFIVYCTSAPLYELGRRFQTGYNAPIINEAHTMSGSGIGRRRLGSSKNTYDLSATTASKLLGQQSSSQVTAHETAQQREERRMGREWREQHGDGESISSDLSQRIVIRKTVEQHSNVI